VLTGYFRSLKHMIKITSKNGSTLLNLEFKKDTLCIIHGWHGSPNTFSHNKQSLFYSN
jgi:hypothetical protein